MNASAWIIIIVVLGIIISNLLVLKYSANDKIPKVKNPPNKMDDDDEWSDKG